MTGPHGGSITSEVTAAITLTVSSMAFAISLAVLVFNGALEAGMPRAIGSFVVAGGVIAVFFGARSQIVPVASFLQDGPAIVLAAVAADFITLGGTGISDVFVLFAITGLATSFATVLLARVGLGGLVRHAPTSVVGAFLGGTGWLLVKGGFDVMINTSLGLGDVAALFGPDLAKFWVPGLLIGLVCWAAGRSPRVPAHALGLIVVGCLVGFYAVVAVVSSVAVVEAGGWLLGPFPEASGAKFVSPDEFRNADWMSIAKTAPGIASVVGLACVSQLLSLGAMKAELEPRLDVDAELRTSAGANLGVALLGVSPAFQGFGYTVLLRRMGATSRVVPVISGALLMGFGVVGVASIGYVPRFIVGAMLVMIGAALLEDWMRPLMRSVCLLERLLGVAIVGVVAWFGLLEGIGVALVTSCAVFIVRYSRVDPVRSASDGRELRSHVDRSPTEGALLAAAGDRLMVFELQGFLFFGSLTTLEDRVRQVGPGPRPIEVLVLDFAHVTGVDTSGFAVIARLLLDLGPAGIEAWVSGLEPTLSEALQTSEPELAAHVLFIPSLESALERAEDEVLAVSTTLALQQDSIHDHGKLSPRLLAEGAAYRFEAGAVIMAQGAPSDGLFIVYRGRLTESRTDPFGTRTRLRRLGEFAVAGEVGLVADAPRSSEVVAEGVVDGWWLPVERYHELRNTQPELIFELHEFIVRAQADRVDSLNQSLVQRTW